VLGQQVVLLDMRGPNPRSGCFNPLDAFAYAQEETSVVARAVANVLAMHDPREQAFWHNWSQSMLTAGVAYLLDHLPPEQCKPRPLVRPVQQRRCDPPHRPVVGRTRPAD
jgi:type IV secretory pathway TraG/TraD family ATPase VirD4